ncbi:MAG TPA: hypothetical protein VFQ61_19975 [Polyangiaceae bacterium]|nr:hypothetical protein [Polyangiaceae bacterium]
MSLVSANSKWISQRFVAPRWLPLIAACGEALVRHAVPIIYVAWFITTAAAQLWAWGVDPVLFPSPDEAVNRLAAQLVSKQGNPFITLPFRDAEDLVHMRLWISVGNRALPVYPPVTYYFYGLLLRLGEVGLWLIASLPAAGIGAFAAGVARLMSPKRRWLGLLAPALAFPATYWIVRPWMNISPMLVAACWALFFWANWREKAKDGWLYACFAAVAFAAAVRPDYAPYLLTASVLFSLAAAPAAWRRIFAAGFAAGAFALGLNLVLNKLTTGNAFRVAYQLVSARETGQVSRSGPLHLFVELLFPVGFPPWEVVWQLIRKYWIQLLPLPALLLAQLAVVPLLFKQARLQMALYAAAVCVVVCVMFARMNPEAFGSDDAVGRLSHTVPRYWTLVYLLAALPPLLLLGRWQWRSRLGAAAIGFGAAAACVLAVLGGLEIYSRQQTSLVYLERMRHDRARWLQNAGRHIPKGALVYTGTSDKLIWSRWSVGMIDDPVSTASSMRRAVDAGLPVYIAEPQYPRAKWRRALERALREQELSVETEDRRSHVYRVDNSE